MEVGRGNNSSQEQVLPALVARSKLAKNHCCCESIVAFVMLVQYLIMSWMALEEKSAACRSICRYTQAGEV